MGEIKGSGSAGVSVSNDINSATFGPWTPLFMGVDQATHGITFDSSWALLVIGSPGASLGSQFAGLRFDFEIGRGPVDPPTEIVWGPMKYTTHHTGGGRGNHTNYSFPLELDAGDQLWIRSRKPTQTGVDPINVFLTVSDQFAPIRPATAHLSTTTLLDVPGPTTGTGFINSPGTLAGVRFPADNALGLWYIMTPLGGLTFDTSWMSISVDVIGAPSTKARWQLGADQPGQPGPPDLPELIDVGFQSHGGGGSHVSVNSDVMNFPIPWEKAESVWIRGAVFDTVSGTPALNHRDFKVAATFWGNP
jgi:hypothetical protein